jgi:hypothetical protein
LMIGLKEYGSVTSGTRSFEVNSCSRKSPLAV